MATYRWMLGLAAALVLGSLAGTGGCALTDRSARSASKVPAASIASRPVLDAKAYTCLDDLDPLPALPAAIEPPGKSLVGDALERFQVGQKLAVVEQYFDAMEEFEAAVQADPRAFEPRLEMGRAAMQAGLFDQANDALDVAVGLRPADPRAHYHLGLLNHLRENDKVAIPHLRRAVLLFGQSGDRIKPLFYLVLCLQRQGYYQAAIDAAGRFESLLAGDLQYQYDDVRWQAVVSSQAWKIPAARAACLRKLGRDSDAIAAYDAALRLDSNRPEVQLALAETLIDVGNTSRAVDLAKAVLAGDRHNGHALAILAATLAAEGRMDELQDRLLTMVRDKPSDLVMAQRAATIFVKFARYAPALETLLLAYDAADDPASLRSVLLQIVFADPDFESAHALLVKLLQRVGRNDQEPLLSLRTEMPVNEGLRGPLAEDSLLKNAGTDRTQLLALAILAEMTDRPVLAEKALRAILQNHPDDDMVAVMTAERLADQCRWQDLIAFVEPRIEKQDDSAAFHRLLGIAYDGLDDLKPAMNHFYEALKRDRQDTRSMWMAARINDRLGQVEPAVSIYQVVVANSPDLWPANLALVRGHLQLGRQQVALAHARKLKELFPNAPAVDLCILIAETGKPVPAAESVSAILDRDPRNPVLLQVFGEACVREGRAVEAVAALTRLLSLKPDDEDGRLLLATALAQQMEYDLARQVVQALLVEHPNRLSWRFAEAELLVQAGRPDQAVPLLEQLQRDSQEPWQQNAVLDRLIFTGQYAGQHDSVIARLRAALNDAPHDRSLQTRLLTALIAADRPQEAIAVVRQWRQDEPNEPLLERLEERLLAVQGDDQAAEALALRHWPSHGETDSAAENPAMQPADEGVSSRDVALLTQMLGKDDAAVWLKAREGKGPVEVNAAALATVAARQGNPLHAVELQRLTGSQDVEDLAQRAQWLFLAGQRAQAEILLMPRIEQANAEVYLRLKRMTAAYYQQLGLGDLALATTAWMQATNRDPARAIEYANDLAYMWAESGMNLPQALDLARMAVAGDPINAAYLDTLGWVHYKMARFDQALSLLKRATALPNEGEDPVLYDHLGDALWRTGQRQPAVAAWKKSAALYRREMRTDSHRPDLVKQLLAVERKTQAVESRRPPNVATSVKH